MVTLLIYFVILVILFSVAFYVLNTFVTDPQVKKMLTVGLVVIAAVVVVYLLLSLAGGGGLHLPSVR